MQCVPHEPRLSRQAGDSRDLPVRRDAASRDS